MSRFGTYIETAKLARMQLTEAEIQMKKGNDKLALRQTIHAFRSFLTAMNNLASLQFQPRKRKVVRP